MLTNNQLDTPPGLLGFPSTHGEPSKRNDARKKNTTPITLAGEGVVPVQAPATIMTMRRRVTQVHYNMNPSLFQ